MFRVQSTFHCIVYRVYKIYLFYLIKRPVYLCDSFISSWIISIKYFKTWILSHFANGCCDVTIQRDSWVRFSICVWFSGNHAILEKDYLKLHRISQLLTNMWFSDPMWFSNHFHISFLLRELHIKIVQKKIYSHNLESHNNSKFGNRMISGELRAFRSWQPFWILVSWKNLLSTVLIEAVVWFLTNINM